MKRLLFAGTGLLSFAFSACTGLMPRDNVARTFTPAPTPGTVVYERKPWQHGPAVAGIPAASTPATSGMPFSSLTGLPLNPAAFHPPAAPVDANAFAATPPLVENPISSPPRRDVAVRTAPDAPEVAPVPRAIEPRVVQKPDWPSFVSARAASPDRPSGIRVIPPDEPIPTAESLARERERPRPAPTPAPAPMPEVAPGLLPRVPETPSLPPVANVVVPPLEAPRPEVVDPPLPTTPPVKMAPSANFAPPANTTSVVANSPQAETILMRIIRAFQENRPQEAIDILNRVDPQNRELLIFLVPIIAELSERPSAAPSQEDLGSMADRLQDALAVLRSKAPLKFETTCYASKIEGYGRYTRLDKGSFAPGSRMQLYLELKNLSWLPGNLPPAKNAAPQKGYLLHMVCQIEILDASGRLIWQSEPMENRDFRHTVPGDYHLTPGFGVPDSLAVGAYKLAVKVTDKPTGRTARTTLDFLVSGERK